MSTTRARENATLSFGKPAGRGSVEETFYPWTLTVDRFTAQGLMPVYGQAPPPDPESERFFPTAFGDDTLRYEAQFGFDPVRRISFTLPFRRLDDVLLAEDAGSVTRRNSHGQVVKIDKATGRTFKLLEAVRDRADWQRIKAAGEALAERYYTKSRIARAYGHLKDAHQRGDFPIRLNLEGFFWTPRELMGIEPHLFAFYDQPDLLHAINETILDVYTQKLPLLLELIPADVVYIMEDLSGKNGPMLSPELFDAFVGSYYARLVPVLKANGVRHVFVDTDGDFMRLIPHFIKAGIEGFLPLDVNAGMDITAVRRLYPELKLIGGYNKLRIAEGQDAIEREFERILPVIRQGGYIPGADHQVPPSASLEDYRFYIRLLKAAMTQSGLDT